VLWKEDDMNKQTKANLEKAGYTVGDAKDFVEDVLTPKVEEMEPEEFVGWLSFHVFVQKPADYVLGDEDMEKYAELLRRLRAERAARKKAETLVYPKAMPASWADGYNAGTRDVLRAMDQAAKVKE